MESSMLVRFGMAATIVAGGIALGAMLGTAANPEMKKPPEKPWQGAFLQAPASADPGYRIMVEAPPQDLSPYQDSYAPTWAREELTQWEPDYPAWTYSDEIDERVADPSGTGEPRTDERSVAAVVEAAAPLEAPAEPVVPADVAPQPATSASYPRLAVQLDALY